MSPASVFAAGKVALITGGASGVGLAVAQLCVKKSMRVAIADFNTSYLSKAKETFATEIKESNVELYQSDVSKPESWTELKKSVHEKFGQVNFLMLNAGITAQGGWGDEEYFTKILGTNLFGVINGINAFFPDLKNATSESAIVLTGSKQGITNPPGNPAYNASKAAVKSLAEQLNYEFKDIKNVSVHLLVPGWTFTGITGGAPDADGKVKEKPAGAWAASQVADYLYRKMEEGQFYAICPDNDVDETTDKKRMLWSVGDIVYGRQPLSRWRDEYKDEAQKWMDEQKL